jgi:hypothetical protein
MILLLDEIVCSRTTEGEGRSVLKQPRLMLLGSIAPQIARIKTVKGASNIME